MRKAIQCLICTFCAFTACYSQNSTGMINTPQFEVFSSNVSEVSKGNELALNEIKGRAIRSLNRNYKNATNVKWYRSPIGFCASLSTADNTQSFAYYDKSGIFEYMIRYYKEDKLPRDVRHLVRSRFYDFSIYQITEVTRSRTTAYIVKLEDELHWKTIKVVGDAIELIDEYIKGK